MEINADDSQEIQVKNENIYYYIFYIYIFYSLVYVFIL